MVDRDPSCHLVEGRFVTDTHFGVRIDCEVHDHAHRECPGEGVMFQDPKPSESVTTATDERERASDEPKVR